MREIPRPSTSGKRPAPETSGSSPASSRPFREVVSESAGPEEACPYLPDTVSRMRYRQIESCSVETYQLLLERGWRRFGRLFFRPDCQACGECRSLRVRVDDFRPNRSMRRTWDRNRDLRILLHRPSTSASHLELYRRYHADMAERRGWSAKTIDTFEYFVTFVQGAQDFGWEMTYYLEDRLVAVALVDVLPHALSAVYCYYDPDHRTRGLGVYSVLRQLELARARGRPHLYLGYRVLGNPSMRYKARYRPHELLDGRPETTEPSVWRLDSTFVPIQSATFDG